MPIEKLHHNNIKTDEREKYWIKTLHTIPTRFK